MRVRTPIGRTTSAIDVLDDGAGATVGELQGDVVAARERARILDDVARPIAGARMRDDRVAALEHVLRRQVREVLRERGKARVQLRDAQRARRAAGARAAPAPAALRAAAFAARGAAAPTARAAVLRDAGVALPRRGQRASPARRGARAARQGARADARGRAPRGRRAARARRARGGCRAQMRATHWSTRWRTAATSGATSVAAPVGVGARTSATKSAIVKSVSWPTPDTTGSRDSKIARATISSLNDHRSSIEPPPRQTISTSTSARALAVAIAAAISCAAPAPCTAHGIDDHAHRRPAPAQRGDDVAQRRGARRRDDAHGARIRRQRALARSVEPAARLELGLEPREALEQRARAGQADAVDAQLELAARLVDRRDRADVHGEAVAQREFGQPRLAFATARSAPARWRPSARNSNGPTPRA